jgi:hypothetical protein
VDSKAVVKVAVRRLRAVRAEAKVVSKVVDVRAEARAVSKVVVDARVAAPIVRTCLTECRGELELGSPRITLCI